MNMCVKYLRWIMEEKKNKKNYIHYIIIFSIILLNLFLITTIVKYNLHGKMNTKIITDTTFDSNQNLSATHNRYISEETIETLDENSKWNQDETLKKELEDTLKTNPDTVEGYDVTK